MSTSPPIQYSGPTVAADVPWEIRRHLQLLYKIAGNHTQAMSILTGKVNENTAATNTTIIEGGSSSTATVGAGGTGNTTLPQNAVLLGNGSAPIQSAAPVQAGDILTDNGMGNNPSFQPLGAASYTYATLPASPAIGQMVVVTDSTVNTWGTAITMGGGTDVVLAWWNGAAWDVVGA